eukprot:TRINITY_DN4973_c0_g1_i6.p1 TRINITY_DN4973_c0_g1~~TRINITY_DN4973_c0_g1_i6.p1  ORF type:complete len:180 (-),score=51.60 TRINITY_DN4973_c0_g1_i6:148-687(-)
MENLGKMNQLCGTAFTKVIGLLQKVLGPRGTPVEYEEAEENKREMAARNYNTISGEEGDEEDEDEEGRFESWPTTSKSTEEKVETKAIEGRPKDEGRVLAGAIEEDSIGNVIAASKKKADIDDSALEAFNGLKLNNITLKSGGNVQKPQPPASDPAPKFNVEVEGEPGEGWLNDEDIQI